MLYNSGPAIYRDDIATRDINKLQKVSMEFKYYYLKKGIDIIDISSQSEHHMAKLE